MIYLCNYTENRFYVKVKNSCQDLVYSISSKNVDKMHENIDLGKIDIDTQLLYTECVNSMTFVPIGKDQYLKVAYNNKNMLPYLRHATAEEIDNNEAEHDFFILALNRNGKRIVNISDIQIAKFMMIEDVFIVSGMVERGKTACIEMYDSMTREYVTYSFTNTNSIVPEPNIMIDIDAYMEFTDSRDHNNRYEKRKYHITRHIPLISTEMVFVLEDDVANINMKNFTKYTYPKFIILPNNLEDHENRSLAEYVMDGLRFSGYQAISIYGNSYDISRNTILCELVQRRFPIRHIIDPSGKILRMHALQQFRREERETRQGR